MDIEYIEIVTFNMFDRVKLDISLKDMKVIKNGKVISISNDKINELLDIISFWDESYPGFKLDSEKFVVRLISDNKIIRQHQGNGMYPENYNEFKIWISDIV